MPKPNLQTVIVDKSVAKTRAAATKVAREHANRIYTSRETKNTWRFRQRPPKDFKKGTFRTFKIPGVKGVSLVYGTLKKSAQKNPVTLAEVRRWERYRERAGEQTNLEDLGELAAKGREIFSDDHMAYMFELSIVDRARDFGVTCGGRPDQIKRCVDELVEGQQVKMFENPAKRRVLKSPRVMPDPGPLAWLGSLLEWRWVDGRGDILWEPAGAPWMFLWSPMLKAVVCVPDPGTMHRKPKVIRKGGAAKLFERFTARDAKNTYEIKVPKTKIKKLGTAGHIVYRSDKWNPGRDIDYIHDFGKGVRLYCGPSLKDPKVFLCFGGKLTATERGLVF